MSTNKPTVTICVTCVGGVLVYDTIRALREAGDFATRVIGVDANPHAQGRMLCDAFFTVPMASHEPEKYREVMTSLLASQKVDVLLALSDAEPAALAPIRDRLIANGTMLSFCDADGVGRLTDKLRLLEAAEKAGHAVGPYRPVEDEASLRVALADLGYPNRKLVLKPRSGTGSRGIVIVDAEQEEWRLLLPHRFCGTGNIDVALTAIRHERLSLSGQLLVPWTGGAVYDVECIAEAGIVLDVAARVRQFENPLTPMSVGHRIETEPRVVEIVTSICGSLNLSGAIDFDIAINEDGAAVPFDAAPRFSGSVGCALTAGANFPAQLVRRLRGMPVSPLSVREGTVIRPFLTLVEIPEANQHMVM